MDTNISSLSDDFYQFIKDNANEDPLKLKLKFSGKNFDFSLDFALLQIMLRSKNRNKLKSLLTYDHFLFPTSLSSEQSSDELVAFYNASLAGTMNNIVDMTAGLGIDSLALALNNNNVTSIELDKLKCDVLKHNAKMIVKTRDIKVICADSLEYLSNKAKYSPISYLFDVIYIDPARRDAYNKRTYSFSDCEPDIIKNFDLLQRIAPRVLVKASPLLDIDLILSQLIDIKCIHIVSARGECKEILIEIEKNSCFMGVKVVEIKNDKNVSSIFFTPDELMDTHAPIIEENELLLSTFLYEPNPGLMKITAFGALCNKFPGLKRISPNTSLYTSSILFKDFPGRILEIERIINRRDLTSLKGEKINITTRNYPLSSKDLIKKIKTKDGNDRFLYAFRAFKSASPRMLLAKKI